MDNRNISVVAMGDVNDYRTFSGTPYHFLLSAKKSGLAKSGWKVNPEKLYFKRYLWNTLRILSFQKPGGFQYSTMFRQSAYKKLPASCFQTDVISFNQHFPLRSDISKNNKLYLYIDATFKQILERYGVANQIGSRIKRKALYWEQKNFEEAEYIVGFTRWVKESIISDYRINPAKISVILAGANIDIPDNEHVSILSPEQKSNSQEFVIGWIGKDWKRKGLELVMMIVEGLYKRGHSVKLNCAGEVPIHIRKNPLVDYWGFIEKNIDFVRFATFMHSCNLGSLFSTAEFSSIAVLEFLRFGIPVTGYKVDGMTDLFPPDASVAFDPKENPERIIDRLEEYIKSENEQRTLINNAKTWSGLVTWDRCVKEWNELLETGSINAPIQLWKGLINDETKNS